MDITTIIANYKPILTQKVTVGQTTATISPTTDKGGVAVPAAGAKYVFLVGKDSTNEEYVYGELTGSTLSNIKHVTYQGDDSLAGFKFTHNIGDEMILTDFSNLKVLSDASGGGGTVGNQLVYGSNFTAADGTFQIPHWTQVKTYADGLVIAGAPDSSTITKGIGTVSVAPALATNPIFVGDNDPRVPTTSENDALQGTSGSPSNTNRYVTNDDVASAATVNKIARRNATGDITVPTTPTAGTDATSKTYVDSKNTYNLILAGSGSTTSIPPVTILTQALPVLELNSWLKISCGYYLSGGSAINGTLNFQIGGVTIAILSVNLLGFGINASSYGMVNIYVKNNNSLVSQTTAAHWSPFSANITTGTGYPLDGTSMGSTGNKSINTGIVQNLTVLGNTDNAAGSILINEMVIEIFNKG